MNKVAAKLDVISSKLGRYVPKAGWLLVDRIVRVIIAFGMAIWVARHFGPEKLGLYNYALSIVAFFSPIALFGIESLLIRDLVRKPGKELELLSSSFALRVCSGLFSVLCVVVVSIVMGAGHYELSIIALILSISSLFQAFYVLDCWFQVKQTTKEPSISRVLAYIISSAVKALIIIIDLDIMFLAYTVLIEVVFCSLFYSYYYHKETRKIISRAAVNLSQIKKYIYEARSLVLTGLAISIYMRVDRIILGGLLDTRAVGLYSMAVQMTEIFYMIPITLTTLIYPKLIELQKSSPDLYETRLKQSLCVFIYASFVIVLIMFFLSDWFIGFMLGTDYKESADVLKIYIFNLPIVAFSAVFSHWYVLHYKTHISLYGTLAGCVSSILLNMLFINEFGLVGAAYASVISMLVPTLFIGLFFDSRVIKLPLEAMLFKFRREI